MLKHVENKNIDHKMGLWYNSMKGKILPWKRQQLSLTFDNIDVQ